MGSLKWPLTSLLKPLNKQIRISKEGFGGLRFYVKLYAKSAAKILANYSWWRNRAVMNPIGPHASCTSLSANQISPWPRPRTVRVQFHCCFFMSADLELTCALLAWGGCTLCPDKPFRSVRFQWRARLALDVYGPELFPDKTHYDSIRLAIVSCRDKGLLWPQRILLALESLKYSE